MFARRLPRFQFEAFRPACLSSADACVVPEHPDRLPQWRGPATLHLPMFRIHPMDIVEMNMQQESKQESGSTGGRPRRNIAKQVLERGQRLRNRAGVLIGMSMGLVALLTVLE